MRTSLGKSPSSQFTSSFFAVFTVLLTSREKGWYIHAMDLYPSDDPIFLRVAKKLSEMTGVPVEQIRPSDRLFDYAEDSLDVVELVMFMEDEFKKNIADDELGKIETVSDLVEYFRKRID